jgi:hypothetical protein
VSTAPTPGIPALVEEFERELAAGNVTDAARYAYVIAQRLRLDARMMEARHYAEECLRLAKTLPSATLDDVTVNVQTLGGIPLPERFHEGVVRARLECLFDP